MLPPRPRSATAPRPLAVPILSALMALSAAQPAPAADPSPAPALDAQIAQLSSDDWRTRQKAVRFLVAAGEDALPRLRQALRQTRNGEIRARLEAAIGHIEEDRRVGATLVTLQLEGASPARAVEELSRAARGSIGLEPPDLARDRSLKPVSLNARKRPFWEVMQALSRQTGLEPTTLTRGGRETGFGLACGDGTWADHPLVLAGPLLLRADRLTRTSGISLRDPGTSNEFSVSLTAFAEPKLRVLDFSGGVTLEEAVDDRGNSLVPPSDNGVPANVEAFGNSRGGNTSHWELGATLHYPKNPGTRIVRLKGSTTFEVQIRAAKLEVPIPGAKNVSRNLDGVQVWVKSADSQRADIVVLRDNRPDPDWYRLRASLLATEARLLDDKGQVVGRSQGGVDIDDNNDGQAIEVRLRFARESGEDGAGQGPGQGAPARDRRRPGGRGPTQPEAVKLLWEFPVETREVVVPFEFRDLPIPR